jgi:spore maturation protein CgeB
MVSLHDGKNIASSFDGAIDVLIVSAFPESLNTNASLQQYVKWAFQSILGERQVLLSPLEASPGLIRQLKPKLVLLFGSCMLDISVYRPIRLACNEVDTKIAFWLHDDPYEFDYSFKAEEISDYIFSNDRWASMHYSHPHVLHLPMAASRRAHYYPWSECKHYDVLFCGAGFPNRIQLVKDLSGILEKYRSSIYGSGWPKELKIVDNQRINNSELAEMYSRSHIVLNIGRHFNLANNKFLLDPSTPGPRTFEAAMAGTVQFYFVESLEITEYFRADEEIILFDGPDDFSRNLERLMDEPLQAKKIALAAQARALKEHSYENRCRKILAFCGILE